MFFISSFFYLITFYSDLTVDSKNQTLLLSREKIAVENLSDSSRIPLDSIFDPNSISSSPFSIWVTSIVQSLTQKYSLRGEFLGQINIGGYDIDSDPNWLLLAGEESYLIQLSTGRKLPILWKEVKRCALGKDSLYLYGDDTLYKFKKSGRLILKKYIPGVMDITTFKGKLGILFKDSLIYKDKKIPIDAGARMDGGENCISILTNSGIVKYPGIQK
ncbi:MAG: hypothetical protein U9N06_06345 [candidate division WOR-3 bacterium]|nr:hypothetical protein [candidate division WOR-3 bacterium]